MRGILFRGKQINNGEWICGNLINGIFFNDKKESLLFIMTGDFIDYDTLNDFTDEYGYYQVDPDTVGQFTGLFDKNGNKIFEGDILKDTLGWVCEVRWDNENGRFLGYHEKPRGDVYICYAGRVPASTIIGNIHDNPELLKGAL